MIEIVATMPWLRRPRRRWLVFGVTIALLALLSVFPRRYVADIKLAPQDSNTTGLSSILSQLGGNYAALIGNHQPVEIDLAIGRSFDVQSQVSRQLNMVKGQDRAALARAVSQLEKLVDVRALRAGILEIEVKASDPEEAIMIADTYAKAMQNQLASLSRRQTSYKRMVLNARMREAAERLTRAENAVSAFRRQNQLIAPDTQLTSSVETLGALRAQYQAVQIELAKARRFNAADSYEVKSIQTALDAIRRQMDHAAGSQRDLGGLTAAGIAPRALQYGRLARELALAQALYDNYTRYLEGAALEDLTADFNMQIIEPAYLEMGPAFNTIPLALLIGSVLLWLTLELYLFRPPPGARLGDI